MTKNYSILVDDVENEELLWHSWIEIAFVLNGYGTLFIDEKQYEIHEEDIFVINSYQIHKVELLEGSHLLSVQITPEFVKYLMPQAEQYVYDCKSFIFSENKQELFTQLKKQLARIISVWSKSKEEFSDLRINIQLIHLIECLVENFGEKRSEGDKKGERWLDLVRYINEAYQENITLKMLAEREFMSQSYFSRMFQKEMGVTFKEYLTEVRLSHALNLLARKEMTVTEICFETGFHNVNSFIESFKQKYGQTPGQYRKSIEGKMIPQKVNCFADGMEFSLLFQTLLKYIGTDDEMTADESDVEIKNIRVCAEKRKENISAVWKQLLNVGYAKDLLNAEIQQQIKNAQNDIGFRYIRFHGILDDDMVVYREQADGTPILNFHYIDQVLDFVLLQNMHPYIEFSYMPKALAQCPECSPFLRCSIVSLPKDYDRWKWLVQSLMEHWQKRYGKAEMKKWIFSPLFSAEMFSMYHRAEIVKYMEVYKITWDCIKACNSEYRIVNPPGTAQDIRDMEKLFDWCQNNNCMPDGFALTCFHGANEGEEKNQNLKIVETDTAFSIAVSKDEDYLQSLYYKLQPFLEKYQIDKNKIILAEWNSNIWQRDLTNDTCYKSAFVFKNILENLNHYAAFGYWTLSDFMEEVPAADDLFHGGFGLFTTNGIPKSSYQALCLLGHLGKWIIDQGEGYTITGNEDEIQIFLYQYCHYETLYRYRHAANLSRTNRYQVFCQERKKKFNFKINGVESGDYQVTRYEVSREHGSAYDEWIRMGAPATVDEYGKRYLERMSYPAYYTEEISCDGELNITEKMEPHEVVLITIKKMG